MLQENETNIDFSAPLTHENLQKTLEKYSIGGSAQLTDHAANHAEANGLLSAWYSSTPLKPEARQLQHLANHAYSLFAEIAII